MGFVKKAAAASVVINANQTRKHSKATAAATQQMLDMQRMQARMMFETMNPGARVPDHLLSPEEAHLRGTQEKIQALQARAQAPVAGWYADPSGVARMRYFDGQAWTEHTA